jgi:uncharacterized protein
MTRGRLSLTILATCLGATCLVAICLIASTAPAGAQSAEGGKLRVIGRATVEAVPDHVSVRVGITNKAPAPTAALDQNSTIAQKIIAFAKKFGIDEKDIRTDAINLSPAFKTVRDANGTTRQEPDGYNASNMVRVRLADLPRLGAFMREVLDQGATNINGVQFGLSHPEKVADEARVKAVEDAQRQAKLLADAAHVKLGSVEQIMHPPRTESRPAFAAPMARAAAHTSVPVEVGVLEVTSEVDVTWRIE